MSSGAKGLGFWGLGSCCLWIGAWRIVGVLQLGFAEFGWSLGLGGLWSSVHGWGRHYGAYRDTINPKPKALCWVVHEPGQGLGFPVVRIREGYCLLGRGVLLFKVKGLGVHFIWFQGVGAHGVQAILRLPLRQTLKEVQ